MFLKVIEVVFVALLALFTITQIILPVVRGQKLFPIFSRQAKLEEELAEAIQEQHEKQLSKQIDSIKKEK